MSSSDATPLPKLPAPALRALRGAGLDTLEKIAASTEADLMALHGMGPSALRPLRATLDEHGLSLRG